jgi:adenosylhomocysteine nucleosidase
MTRRSFSVLFFLVIGLAASTFQLRAENLYAICGAYPPEMTALKAEFEISEANGWQRTVIKGIEFWRGTSSGKAVLLFRTGMSPVNAAYQLQVALDRFPITHILFGGVAGGIDPSLDVGDIVIPAQWAYHDEAAYLNEDPAKPGEYLVPDYLKPKLENFGMVFPDSVAGIREGQESFEDQPFFPADPELLAVARRVAPSLPKFTHGGRTITVNIGDNGVAGTVFLDNAKYREWVFRVWKARCLDMESTALAHVAWANHIPILIVRGLSDLAGGQHGKNPIDDNELNVSETAAKVVHAVLAAH